MSQEFVYGIDLGTTNSCLSVLQNGQVRTITIDGKTTIPSVVAWKDGAFLVGTSARNHMMVSPEQGVSSIKRKMDDPSYTVQLGDERLSPIDISAKILSYLAQEGSKEIGNPIKNVVITVPAWFQESQRQATLAAGKKAGLEVMQIVNEPTAAALAYENHELSESQQEKWLVYDLGGGTFDVSVLNVSQSAHEVLATSGNSFLGGDDFDQRLIQRFVEKVQQSHNIDIRKDPILMAKWRLLAEQVKITLSAETSTSIDEPFRFQNETYRLQDEVSRTDFETMISDLVGSTLDKVWQTLEESKVKAEELDRLLLVGGSTRIPMIADKLSQTLNMSPDTWIDPDLSVSYGAAIQAGIKAGIDYQRSVIDVCPHTLGIAALGPEDNLEIPFFLQEKQDYPLTFAPLIRKNSRLPASFIRTFRKIHDEQEQLEVVVLQGESSITTNNHLIGRFMVDLDNHQSSEIDIRFTYDLNGVVRVSVEEAGGKRNEYSLDLSKPYTDGFGEFDLIEDEEQGEKTSTDQNQVSNYLIEQIKKYLREEDSDFARVSSWLEDYKKSLVDENDELMDELEDKLYTWLESKES